MQNSESCLSYQLPAQLTAETIGTVHEELRKLSNNPHTHYIINASAVETITSPGAQMLVSLHKSVALAEGELAFSDPSSLFSQTLAELGLGWLVTSFKA